MPCMHGEYAPGLSFVFLRDCSRSLPAKIWYKTKEFYPLRIFSFIVNLVNLFEHVNCQCKNVLFAYQINAILSL